MPRLKRGRPLLLGAVLDEKVKHFLLQLRKKGGLVNTVAAAANCEEQWWALVLESTTWAKSLFKRMGFCKRPATTSKPEIPELAKREEKLLLQHQGRETCYSTFDDLEFWSNAK